jgi:hypothetical protein
MLPIQTNLVGLQDALQAQDDIGWDTFVQSFEGYIAIAKSGSRHKALTTNSVGAANPLGVGPQH